MFEVYSVPPVGLTGRCCDKVGSLVKSCSYCTLFPYLVSQVEGFHSDNITFGKGQ